jgi:predicted DCC family thiol-disulfide oxidoreductase YuxK
MEAERIVFFDDDCLLCQGSLKWLNRLDADDRLLFAPLRGRLAEERGIDQALDSIAFFEGGKVWRSSEAVRQICQAVGGAGLLCWAVLSVIPHPVRECGYRLVAKNRKRFRGGASCPMLEEGMKRKMQE